MLINFTILIYCVRLILEGVKSFMEKIDYELEKELSNGNFSRIDLDSWFKTYQYNYIFCAIQGCDKVINVDVLQFIIIYAELLMSNPNPNLKNDKESVIWNCEYLLSQVVIVASRHFEEYKCVIERLFHSESEMVRLYCNANCPLWFSKSHGFEITERIQKVRELRKEFYHCWDEGVFSEITKNRILFLVKALELKVINYVSYNREVEFSPISICSLLFENYVYNISKFDIDVLYVIDDKRILGYCLNKMIEDDYLQFKEDCFLPSNLFFHTGYCISSEHIKVKRPKSITTFNGMYTIKE